MKFYASVRLDIRRTGQIKEGDEIVGNETKVKVVKNKMAPPFKETMFQILYGKGFNRLAEIVDHGVQYEFIEKSGPWYSLNKTKIGQGKNNAMAFLQENPEICAELESKIINRAFNGITAVEDKIPEFELSADAS